MNCSFILVNCRFSMSDEYYCWLMMMSGGVDLPLPSSSRLPPDPVPDVISLSRSRKKSLGKSWSTRSWLWDEVSEDLDTVIVWNMILYLTLWNTLLLAIAINKKFNCQLTFCFVESFLLKNPTCGGLTGERMERNDL